MKIPFKCPVCGGTGLVPHGFYNQTSGNWSTTDITPERCRSCEFGIVWGSIEDEKLDIKIINDNELPHISIISCETCEHFISPTETCGKECENYSKWKKIE